MTASHEPEATPGSQRLAIVHLLGWTLGVAIVLAIYRAAAAWRSQANGGPVVLSWVQLGFAMAYGTAISGLGLYLWRWRTGVGSGPTQPGHWLLVFAGLGLVIDVTTSAVLELSISLVPGLLGMRLSEFAAWLTQQAVAWGLAWVISVVALARMRAGRMWTAVAWVLMLYCLACSLACLASNVGRLAATGIWPWYLPIYVRIIGLGFCLVTLIAAELGDRLRGASRDWLHGGGIAAALLLGLMDLSMNSWVLARS